MISQNYKSPLQFYNDKSGYLNIQKKPHKPRKSRYETEEEHQERVMKWKASLPHDVEDPQPKGNKMTQKYYTERLLLIYIKKLQEDSRSIL